MKKIPCLFKRDFDNPELRSLCKPEFDPRVDLAKLPGAVGYRKWDGTAVRVFGGKLWRRHDLKVKRIGEAEISARAAPPEGWVPCDAIDPVTYHHVGWLPVLPEDPAAKWIIEAWDNRTGEPEEFRGWPEITMEACGPKINGNHEKLDRHVMLYHRVSPAVQIASLPPVEAFYEDLKRELTRSPWEGFVFWAGNEPLCKIRRVDFGLEWPVK